MRTIKCHRHLSVGQLVEADLNTGGMGCWVTPRRTTTPTVKANGGDSPNKTSNNALQHYPRHPCKFLDETCPTVNMYATWCLIWTHFKSTLPHSPKIEESIFWGLLFVPNTTHLQTRFSMSIILSLSIVARAVCSSPTMRCASAWPPHLGSQTRFCSGSLFR